jgi:hypothetical protein
MVDETEIRVGSLDDIAKLVPKPELDRSPVDDFNDELSKMLESERGRTPPDINAFQDAVVIDDDGDPVFVPGVGERVIIERWISFDAKRVWLDTETYRIVSVDHETGVLDLVNDSLRQHAMSNFIEGTKRGYRFKLPGTGIVGKRHRGRPKRRRSEYSEPAPKPTGAPKKRGRPKGSKNRSKDIVAAEKAKRLEKKREKMLKREARKRLRGR